MATIGIIGSGNVGANTAFFVAERDFAHVCLYDMKDGLSTGKALDMMEAAPLRRYQHRIRGTDDIHDVLGCEVIIVAAGEIRSPGENREDLYERNKPIVDEVGRRIASFDGVAIVMTEPVDAMTMGLVKAGLDRRKVVGVGGVLDTARLQALIARELGVAQEDVKTTVIGRHSADMIALPAYCSVAGVPVTRLISDARLAELVREMVKSGDRIVELAQRVSSYYGPAAAATDIAEAVIRGTNRIMSVSMMLDGQYGIAGVAMSLPALIGSGGIARVLEPKLTEAEQARLAKSAASLEAYA